MTYEEREAAVDKMDVKELLRLTRFEPVGSPWFNGPIGDYLSARLSKLHDEDPAAYVTASKELGWE